MDNRTFIIVAHKTARIITLAKNSACRMAIADSAIVMPNKTARIIVITHNNACCVTVANGATIYADKTAGAIVAGDLTCRIDIGENSAINQTIIVTNQAAGSIIS